MKRINSLKDEWLQILILLAPWILIAAVWGSIPEFVPMHWDASGHVNGYTEKGLGLVVLPLINVGVAALLFWIATIDPKAYKMKLPSTTLKPLRLIITAFISALTCYSIMLSTADLRVNGSAIYIGTGILFLLIGNYLPRVKPNYFVGYRTPWALENPENWRLTHIFAGKLLIVASILEIAIQVFVPTDDAKVVYYPYLAVIILPPFIYSYVLFQKRIVS
jgi:uncharacterized membrane protein